MNSQIPVLVVLHPDGWCQVFGNPQLVYVTIARMPAVAEGGLPIAEEWVETTIPQPHQSIYWPGNLLASSLTSPLTPTEIATIRYDLEVSRALDSIARAST